MSEKEVDYIQLLTAEDKIRVRFTKKRGKITRFVVQYYSLINSRWRTITRVDTCHGYPHKHVYHLKGKEYIIKLTGDNNTVFTKALNDVKENYKRIKENFLFVK